MPFRRVQIVNACFYHIFNRSISGYQIFNDYSEYNRFLSIMKYYRFSGLKKRYSFCNYDELDISAGKTKVDILSYCIMPTHYHMTLFQNEDNGIEKYICSVQKSYSLYFNQRHKRKGPLWESRFKAVAVKSNEQLVHLTRYQHLNPVTAYLISKPEDWNYSSYKEYIELEHGFCDFVKYINMTPDVYKVFVEDQIDYQRDLDKIKKLILD